MRVWILLFLLCILIAEAKTERLDMSVGDSYSNFGRNITLVKFDAEKDKAIFCVNNEKVIVSEDKSNFFKDVTFELKRVDRDSVIVDIKILCRDCVCDKDCKNDKCVVKKEEDECIEDEDCDDRNILTVDKCIDKKCFHYEKEVFEEELNKEEEMNNTVYALIFIFLVVVATIFVWIKYKY